jgi:chaperonin GroES
MIKALSDLVFIKRENPEDKVGSIVIPKTSQKESTIGVIVAAGPGLKLDNGKIRQMDVQVGDKVYFNEWIGMKVEVEGEEYTVMHEDEIDAVFH